MITKLQVPGGIRSFADVERILNQWFQCMRVGVQSGDLSGSVNAILVALVPYIGAAADVNLGGKNLVAGNIHAANWDTAYGWGNHAGAGYASVAQVEARVLNLTVETETKTVITGVDFVAQTVTTEDITYVKSVTANYV